MKNKNMEIYVRVDSPDSTFGMRWYSADGWSCLQSQKRDDDMANALEVLCDEDGFGDYKLGTVLKSMEDARRAGRKAVSLAKFDGYTGVKVSYWTYENGVLTKLKTR